MTHTKFILFLFMSGIGVVSNAQKLPGKQAASIRAPDNIKIDGKTTEWGDKFRAYNSASRVYYTVSNDDVNLYLTARMDGWQGTDKAILGGFIFTIQPSAASKLKNIKITYSTLSDRRKTEVIRDNMFAYNGFSDDTVANRKKIDTLIANTN